MKAGYSDVLIGLQFGDEGKAKVIDIIGKNYDIIARFNGGSNAGHTIATSQGKIALHQIPAGIFYPKTLLYIGSGCVINFEKLVTEIESVDNFGIKLGGRLFISSQASVIQPHHLLIDEIIGKAIGTTKNGIGPAYADKALRSTEKGIVNIRFGDLADNEEFFLKQIKKNLKDTVAEYNLKNIDVPLAMENFKKAYIKIKPYIQKDSLFLTRLVESGKKVLFEGAQSFMLDVTKGAVPYVTSSNTAAGAAYVGGDLSPHFHRKTIGVGKAIMSRVGNGPFVSEFGGEKSEAYCIEGGGNKYGKEAEQKLSVEELLQSDDLFEIGRALRMLGDEYGASTGRPRRVGMLDLVQLRYAVRSNGVDLLWLNKCDLLSDFSRTKLKGIPFVSQYIEEEKSIDYVPSSNVRQRRIKREIEYEKNFPEKIRKLRNFKDLPKNLLHLLARVESDTGCELLGIGVGSKRDEYILKK